jgi:hypothetical protein
MSKKKNFDKDNDIIYKKKRIVAFSGGDITFKDVEGYRKDVVDVKMGREVVLDRMEKKMRLFDIIKQYELFFNQKLKIYDKKYINELVELLDNNDIDYLDKRIRLIESKKTFPLFKTLNSFQNKKLFSTIENNEKKYMSKTSNGFNRKGRRFERRVTTRSLLSQFDNSSQKDGLEAFNKAIEFEKKHYYLNTSPNLSSNQEKNLFFNKIIKKKSEKINMKKDEEELIDFERNNLKFNSINNTLRRLSFFSKPNQEDKLDNNNKFSSYFEESLGENSYISKRIRNEKHIPKGEPIKTLDIIKTNPMIFKRPFSMLGDYYKSHKFIKY